MQEKNREDVPRSGRGIYGRGEWFREDGIWQFTDSPINCQRVDKREQVCYLYLGAGACSTKHVPEAEPRPLGGRLL